MLSYSQIVLMCR